MSAEDKPAPAPEPSWPRTVTLKHPVEYDGQRITHLTFRRGKNGDMKGLKLTDGIDAADLTRIAARLCGQSVVVIDELDIDDAGEVNAIALDFYAKYLKGGGASSR